MSERLPHLEAAARPPSEAFGKNNLQRDAEMLCQDLPDSFVGCPGLEARSA
jgi:hypothetical protein